MQSKRIHLPGCISQQAILLALSKLSEMPHKNSSILAGFATVFSTVLFLKTSMFCNRPFCVYWIARKSKMKQREMKGCSNKSLGIFFKKTFLFPDITTVQFSIWPEIWTKTTAQTTSAHCSVLLVINTWACQFQVVMIN